MRNNLKSKAICGTVNDTEFKWKDGDIRIEMVSNIAIKRLLSFSFFNKTTTFILFIFPTQLSLFSYHFSLFFFLFSFSHVPN